MASQEHLDLLKQGVDVWNQWRKEHPEIEPDLSKADFRDIDLSQINFTKADLSRANLNEANRSRANLSQATLVETNFSWSNLSKTDLNGANLTRCFVYATSAWDIKLEGTKQSNLIITNPYTLNMPVITVDNIEVAQFIYLLLNNQKIRDVIDTITSKVVLILGRFTLERKIILDAIREELR